VGTVLIKVSIFTAPDPARSAVGRSSCNRARSGRIQRHYLSCSRGAAAAAAAAAARAHKNNTTSDDHYDNK